MTKVFWEQAAQKDREEIFNYLLQEAGTAVAIAADEKFTALATLLCENPYAGLKAGKSDMQRKLVVPHFPFILVYALAASDIYILRVLHTARKLTGSYKP